MHVPNLDKTYYRSGPDYEMKNLKNIKYVILVFDSM